MAIATVNPATGETVKTYGEMSQADVDRCLAAAVAAHAGYRLTSFEDRASWMRQAAGILDGELSHHGIREFCNVKTVWVGASPR